MVRESNVWHFRYTAHTRRHTIRSTDKKKKGETQDETNEMRKKPIERDGQRNEERKNGITLSHDAAKTFLQFCFTFGGRVNETAIGRYYKSSVNDAVLNQTHVWTNRSSSFLSEAIFLFLICAHKSQTSIGHLNVQTLVVTQKKTPRSSIDWVLWTYRDCGDRSIAYFCVALSWILN